MDTIKTHIYITGKISKSIDCVLPKLWIININYLSELYSFLKEECSENNLDELEIKIDKEIAKIYATCY